MQGYNSARVPVDVVTSLSLSLSLSFSLSSLQQLCYSFDIFHMRESLIPVDTIEVKG